MQILLPSFKVFFKNKIRMSSLKKMIVYQIILSSLFINIGTFLKLWSVIQEGGGGGAGGGGVGVVVINCEV